MSLEDVPTRQPRVSYRSTYCWIVRTALTCAIAISISGCGTSIRRNATEQLLLSDAIDRSVAQIDFSPLEGRKVFFDSKYVVLTPTPGFSSASYINSALRQQMSAAGCKLQDSAASADYVVEARVGAVGTDLHDVTYGLPASNALNAAATVLSNIPAVPAIPEISLANRNDQSAAAKIAVFAYHRETREPVWQSGIATARSSAKDTWVLGAGPIQRGSIYNGTLFAGNRIRVPFMDRTTEPTEDSLPSMYAKSRSLNEAADLEQQLADAQKAAESPATESGVQQASHEQ